MNSVLTVLSVLFLITFCGGITEEDEGVKYANLCEVCKVLATELEGRLEETGKTHDVIEIGYSLDDVKPKKKFKYQKSELRLVESLDGICNKILEYNIHKERADSTRFAKGMSQTFQTLHGLVDKGVKVELGIPYELWDKPSVEITNLKTQCETLLETHEADIEDWYWKRQGDIPLKDYLCAERALKGKDNSCLTEVFVPEKKEDKKKKKGNKTKKKKTKGDKQKQDVTSDEGNSQSEEEISRISNLEHRQNEEL